MNKGVISYEQYERSEIARGHLAQSVASLEAQLEVMGMEVQRWKAIDRQENKARVAEEKTP